MAGWTEPQVDSLFCASTRPPIHYKRAGQGLPVLLLHGSGSSLQGFEEVALRLASSFDVIRPDLPGCGLTGPRPDRDYRISTYATTIAQFMANLGTSRYAVVGNSLGGNIAWNLALDERQRVAGLVLINATGYPEKSLPSGLRLARNPLLRPILRRWVPRRGTERSLRDAVGIGSTIVDDDMVDRVHALMSRAGNRAAFVDFANTQQEDRSAELPRLTTRTLVLRSASLDGQHFARDIPASQELVHADAGHLLPEEDPAWVAAAVKTFLESVAGTVTREGAHSP